MRNFTQKLTAKILIPITMKPLHWFPHHLKNKKEKFWTVFKQAIS